jgi:hypothetical protein
LLVWQISYKIDRLNILGSAFAGGTGASLGLLPETGPGKGKRALSRQILVSFKTVGTALCAGVGLRESAIV